jgi:uncharacterized protein (DUF2336 family)
MVRDFLQWLGEAPARDRAEVAGSLALAYVYSDLAGDEVGAAEAVMLWLVDDPSPLVRRALADALAASPLAPPAVIMALAADQAAIAAPVYALSPLFVDADLLDAVASGGEAIQAAIASRAALPSVVAAAIADLGSADACHILAENHAAEIGPGSIDRIVERFGDIATIREALLARSDIPAAARQNLVAKVSEVIAGFVIDRAWLEAGRARRIVREACEKATVTIAAESAKTELRPLIRHLRLNGHLTTGLILRALLSGNVGLFEQALAELSGMPLQRVGALVRDRSGTGLPALLQKAQLPPSTHRAFEAAIAALREGFVDDADGAIRLQRRMIERVLTACEGAEIGEIAPLITLLRRFATEAAREDARLFCQELMAEPPAITYSAAA